MQTLTFENYQGQIIFHWYMLSLKKKKEKKFCLRHFEYVHVYTWCICLQIIVFLYPPSVFLLCCRVTPVDLSPPLIKGQTVCLCVVLLENKDL